MTTTDIMYNKREMTTRTLAKGHEQSEPNNAKAKVRIGSWNDFGAEKIESRGGSTMAQE